MNSCLGEIVEEQEVIDFLQLHIRNIMVMVTRTVIPIQDLISKENIS